VAVSIYADLTNRQFVSNTKGTAAKGFSSPFHQDKLYWSIQPLRQNANGASTSDQMEVLDAAAYAITVLIRTTAGVTLAGPNVFTTIEEQAKVGSIDLNTAAMATAMGSGSEVSAVVEIQFDDGATEKVTVTGTMTIKRTYLTSGTPSELPLTRYPTWEEALAVFVRFAGNVPGSSITLPDETNTYELVVKCNSDGSNASNAGT
jgi:hypothetical protein